MIIILKIYMTQPKGGYWYEIERLTSRKKPY